VKDVKTSINPLWNYKCPKCKSRNINVDEGYDIKNPSAPTRCNACNFVDSLSEFEVKGKC